MFCESVIAATRDPILDQIATCCPIEADILPAVRLYPSTPSDFRRYVDRRKAHRRKAEGDQED